MIKKEINTILLADDDATDRELFIEALNLSGFNYNIIEVANGQEVIDYLNKSGSIIPDFILLDFKYASCGWPGSAKIYKEASAKLNPIPVLVLSTSNSPYDVKSSYEAGASLFIVKPDDFNELSVMVKNILSLFKLYVAIPEI